MKTRIIDGSHYGTSRLYAQELSRRTGVTAVSHTQVENPETWERAVYVGGLYANRMVSLQKTATLCRKAGAESWISWTSLH